MAKMQKRTQASDDTTQDLDEGENDAPQYVTVEQLNAAITGKLGELKRQMPKLMEPVMNDVKGQLAQLLERFNQDPDAEPTGKKQKGEDPEIARMRKEFQAQQDAMRKMQEERQREVEAARRDKQRSLLDAALTKVGITNDALRSGAARLLEDRIGSDEEGRIVFKRQNAYGLEEAVDVETAIGDWAKTNDGKAFLPARKVAGTGSAPISKTPAIKGRSEERTAASPEDRLTAADNELMRAVMGLPPSGSEDDE